MIIEIQEAKLYNLVIIEEIDPLFCRVSLADFCKMLSAINQLV